MGMSDPFLYPDPHPIAPLQPPKEPEVPHVVATIHPDDVRIESRPDSGAVGPALSAALAAAAAALLLG